MPITIRQKHTGRAIPFEDYLADSRDLGTPAPANTGDRRFVPLEEISGDTPVSPSAVIQLPVTLVENHSPESSPANRKIDADPIPNDATLPPPLSMADLVERIRPDLELTEKGRGDRISAINRFCRFLDRSPAEVSADVGTVKKFLGQLTPASCRLAPKSYQNMVSLLRDSLNRYRPRFRDNRPADFELPPRWLELIKTAPEPRRLIVLRRFMRYCAENGWGPEDVGDEKLGLFARMLVADVIIDDKRHIRNVIGAWNRSSRTVHGWPDQQLSPIGSKRRFSVDWEDFPQSLQNDLDAFILSRTNPVLAGGQLTSRRQARPIKGSSAEAARYSVRALASALVRSGVPIEQITNLAFLVRPDIAEISMGFFVYRHGGAERSAQTHGLATTLVTIGRLWCKLDEDQMEALENIRDNCTYIQVSMTEKNRERLRSLKDDHTQQLLFNLSTTLQKEAETTRNPRIAASRMMVAVALEILLHCPIRIGNLARLERSRHFRKGSSGRNGALHLAIPKTEVKNGVELEFELPQVLVDFIGTFIRDYRPTLTSSITSDFLFPTKSGTAIATNTLREAFIKQMKRHLGVAANPQLFRHLDAELHLEANPGHYETVRQFLGHMNVKTTTTYYCGMESTTASKHYQATLLEKRRRKPSPKRDR